MGGSERRRDRNWLSTRKGHVALGERGGKGEREMIMKEIIKHEYSLVAEADSV